MIQPATRAELLARTPDRYLAEGWRDAAGGLRPDLQGTDATAAATQLAAAGLSPQELGFTLEAIRLLLPRHDEPDPQTRLHATIEEALETVARAIQQRNNQGLLQWLSECDAHVQTEADIASFIAHMQAVTLQHALLAALLSSEPPSSSP